MKRTELKTKLNHYLTVFENMAKDMPEHRDFVEFNREEFLKYLESEDIICERSYTGDFFGMCIPLLDLEGTGISIWFDLRQRTIAISETENFYDAWREGPALTMPMSAHLERVMWDAMDPYEHLGEYETYYRGEPSPPKPLTETPSIKEVRTWTTERHSSRS